MATTYGLKRLELLLCDLSIKLLKAILVADNDPEVGTLGLLHLSIMTSGPARRAWYLGLGE